MALLQTMAPGDCIRVLAFEIPISFQSQITFRILASPAMEKNELRIELSGLGFKHKKIWHTDFQSGFTFANHRSAFFQVDPFLSRLMKRDEEFSMVKNLKQTSCCNQDQILLKSFHAP